MRLYNFFRSSASYRVRIALALKGLDYEYVPVSLIASEHLGPEHRARNPQALVPVLEVDGLRITQSLAILDFLDRRWPEPPLYPRDEAGRARVLSLAAYVASEIQPLQNLRVERYLEQIGLDAPARTGWRTHWVTTGLAAVEEILGQPETGQFCHCLLYTSPSPRDS